MDILVELSASDGNEGTSGCLEVAIVYQHYIKYNAHPLRPDTPGHFTCNYNLIETHRSNQSQYVQVPLTKRGTFRQINAPGAIGNLIFPVLALIMLVLSLQKIEEPLRKE